MLFLHTGVPGHGKTLFTIDFVEKFKTNQKDDDGNALPDRPVFYHNIDELQLDWNYFDNPEKWYELPENAIIVIDECQEFFPVRGAKDTVPEKCSRFERHRHKGWDIFLITQHPKLIDVHVRRLTGKHRHIERKLGLQKATIYTNDKYFDPDNFHDKAAAQKTPWSYPKKHFKSYKSATQHTVKREIPKWLYLIPLLIAGIVYAFYHVFTIFLGADTDAQLQSNPASPSSYLPQQKQTLRDYTFAQMMQPEVSNIPQSSPYYRSIYKATSYPKPNCITNEKRNKCSCFSQQSTRMNVTLDYCLHVVDNGVFDPTVPDKKVREGRRK